jgi:hypothetical protein
MRRKRQETLFSLRISPPSNTRKSLIKCRHLFDCGRLAGNSLQRSAWLFQRESGQVISCDARDPLLSAGADADSRVLVLVPCRRCRPLSRFEPFVATLSAERNGKGGARSLLLSIRQKNHSLPRIDEDAAEDGRRQQAVEVRGAGVLLHAGLGHEHYVGHFD